MTCNVATITDIIIFFIAPTLYYKYQIIITGLTKKQKQTCKKVCFFVQRYFLYE